MFNPDIIDWLLEGDVSIQYMVHNELLYAPESTVQSLKNRIDKEGFGKRFLDAQHPNGDWGRGFYQPKWTSTHYTLLDLRNLGINPTASIIKAVDNILEDHIGSDGGVNPSGTISQSDICINGMFLNYASFFGIDESRLMTIVDLILALHMTDGGYNCRINRSGAHHSSVHSTICVIEGIRTYHEMGYAYRLEDLLKQEKQAQEFLLKHHLYQSDRTGEVIHKSMTMLSYPWRWKYNFLRALYYFTRCDMAYDHRMDDAVDLLISKRKKDGTWPLQAKHVGEVHFDMEQGGKASRINTLMALKILKHYQLI